MEMMKPYAIGYCRVSTSKQELSLVQQQAAIKQWCELNGYYLVGIYTDEDVSATTPLLMRSKGRGLPQVTKDYGAKVIVSTYLDRLFRDALDGLRTLREHFEPAGLRVVLVNQGLDLSTPEGRMHATIMLATAEYERDMIAARTRRASQKLQADGRVYGHVPYGCVAIDGQLYRHPTQWALREDIITELDQTPLREVQTVLRQRRMSAPAGGRSWSLNTLSNLAKTHDRLSQLPMAPEHGAGQGGALEAGASS